MAERVSRNATALLGVAIGIAVAFSLWETRGQTLFSDEWGRLFLAQQDSLRADLLGYSGHLVFLHAVLYRAIFSTFGADTYLPFRILEALLLALNSVLFFSLARTRTTPGVALAATLPLLVLGSAAEVTATPFGIVVLLPVAFGLGALLSAARLGPAGDPLTCVLLVGAIASLSDGLAFLAGVAVLLWLQSGRGALRRAWVIAVPVVLYAAWWIWAHHNGIPNRAPLDNIQQVPAATLDSAAAGIAALSGFFGGVVDTGAGKLDLSAGYLLLGLGLVVLLLRRRDGWRSAREIWVPLATALAFWALLGMVISPERPVTSSRYLYPSAVFLLLIAVEVIRDARPHGGARAALVVAGALALSLVPNIVNLNRQAGSIRDATVGEETQLGALEILAHDRPGQPLPGLRVDNGLISVDSSGYFSADAYLNAVDQFGSPGASPAEIAATGGLAGAAADQILIQNGDLGIDAPSAAFPGSCRSGGGGGNPVPPHGLLVRATGSRPPVVMARRFGPAYQHLPTGRRRAFTIDAPTGTPLWFVQVRGGVACWA